MSTLVPAVLVLTGLSILAALLIFSEKQLNWDCAALLQSTQLMLKGAMPYVDFGSTNPPMIYYLNIGPVLLSQITGLDLPRTFWMMVFMLLIYSGASFVYISSHADLIRTRSNRLFALSIFVGFSLLVFAQGDFGQREHLFFLGYFPLFLCRVARYQGYRPSGKLGAVLGLVGGLTALLKPHFVILVILLEIWMIMRKRRLSELWTPEIGVQFGVGFLFAIHFLLVPAPMRNAIFQRWIPFVMKGYDVYNRPLVHIQYLASPLNVALIGILLILLYYVVSRRYHRQLFLLESMFLAALLSLGGYILQHKAFSYHIIPHYGFLLMTGAVLVLLVVQDLNASGVKSTSSIPPGNVGAVLILALVVCTGYLGIVRSALRYDRVSDLEPFIDLIQAYSRKTDRVTFISSSLTPAYPTLIYADRITGTRYLHAFPIPMLYKNVHMDPDGTFPYRNGTSAPKEEVAFLQELGDNVVEHKPKLIFIHAGRQCQACPEGFVIKDYLESVGWIERYLVPYRYLQRISDFEVYVRCAPRPQAVVSD